MSNGWRRQEIERKENEARTNVVRVKERKENEVKRNGVRLKERREGE